MADIIKIKRGQLTTINSAQLQEGELGIGFNADKSTAELYTGNGTGTPIPVNGAKIAKVLTDAQAYVDEKISALVGTAPEAYDTIQELAQYISTHDDAYQALLTVVGKKLEAPETAGTTGQILKLGEDGKLHWENERDTTYPEATQQAAGLMSAEDKTKLDDITAGVIDGGTWDAE